MERTEIGSKLNIASATHAGMTGKHNEDFLDIWAWKAGDDRKFYLGIVADGVGGQTAGEVASRLTVSTIQKYFDGLQSLGDINQHLEDAILAANRAVYRESQKNSEYKGMSTTIAIAAMIDKQLYTAHVGDSRIYLLRGGQLMQISIDHTWAQEAIDAGLLTPEQAKTHPNRNVIRRHLGGGNQVEVDHRLNLPGGESKEKPAANQGTSLKSGDTILICSDGLSDMISVGAILSTLQNHFQELPVAANELVDKANRAGGKDNITIVLMQIPGVVGAVAPVVPPVAAVGAAAASRAKAPTVAAKTGVVVASTSATGQAAAAKSGVSGLTWFLVVGAILFFLAILAVGIVLVVGDSMRSGTTPEATTEVPAELPDATLPVGAPATAAILATAQSATGTADSAGPVDTPGLIPTLRSTVTKTPIRRPTVVRTSTPEPVATNTPSSSGSSGSSSGSSGGSSGPKPPTPKPPTAEPPTAEPPTVEPPTVEPPTEEPPTEEPPTEEPPTVEP
jgi:serine/threonine protein phosphatase PrpC